MPGAILQLNAYGSENEPLNGNPDVNFFRSVFRRYTNFALQNINLELHTQTTPEDPATGPVLRARLDRHGDQYFARVR